MLSARLYASIIALCRIGTGAAFGILIGTVLIQVVSRTFLTSSPVWTEELTRHALLFLAAFGVGRAAGCQRTAFDLFRRAAAARAGRRARGTARAALLPSARLPVKKWENHKVKQYG